MKSSFIIILLLLYNILLFAKIEIAGYPSAGYSNETGIYGGATTYLRHRPTHFDLSAPKNIFYLSSSYSEKKQFILHFQPTVYFRNGLYKSDTVMKFKKWPSNFYGIGMNTDRENFENYLLHEISIKTALVRRLSDLWDIALCYEYLNYDISKMEEAGLLIYGSIPGSKNSRTSGIGFMLNYDNRNIESFPTSGNLLSLQINHFSKYILSDHKFTEYIIDIRKYLQIHRDHTIALQTFFSTIQEDVPFYQMNYLDDNMRAVTSNLFIDKNAFVIRVEDRIFWWHHGFKQRFGMVLFSEIGEVASEIDKFGITDLQFNYGFGFRYSFFLEDRLNVRIDIGFGEVKANLSIGSGEMF